MRLAVVTTDSREHYRTYEVPLPHFGTAPAALLQGLGLHPEVEVHVLSCARARMQPDQQLAENIQFHSLYVPKIGWLKTAYQGCIRAVRAKLSQIQPHIVHGQGTEHDCALNAVFSGFPNVLTIHGNMRLIARLHKVKPFSPLWVGAQLESLAIRRSAGVLCITRYTQQSVQPFAKRTWIVPNAVDASFFDISAEPPGEVPRILCVGVICSRKNQNAFIQALDGLAQERNFKLIFLGLLGEDESYNNTFKRLVNERSWCTHAGFAERNQLKAELRQSAILALPSLEDNCPMAVLEAMAAGVPVVAANVGGVPELVTDGVTGRTCDPLDPSSMSTAVERTLSDRETTLAIARRAKEQAYEKYHPKAIAGKHLEIYREVLNHGVQR
jgi:glycosyltransferase involved in cell wall biosynthesis